MHLSSGLSVLLASLLLLVLGGVNADTADDNAKKLNQHFFSYFYETRTSSSQTGKSGSGPTGSSDSQTQGTTAVDSNKVDLLFVIDNSGSIGSDDFVKQKDFVNLMIDHSLTVTCNRSTRIALISFAELSQTKIEFDFDDHSVSATPRADLKSAVNAIAYVNGDATNTAGALTEAHSLFNDASRGGRSDATRIVFVITDGRSNEGGPPGPEADILRDTDGVVIFVMGVANFQSVSSQTELHAIASDPENDEGRVLVVDDFDDMEEIAARFGARKSGIYVCSCGVTLIETVLLLFIEPRCDLIDLATNRPEDWNSILAGFTILKQNGVVNNMAALHSQVFSIFGSAHRYRLALLKYDIH